MSALDVRSLLHDLNEFRREREGSSITTAFNLVAFVEDDPELAALIAERIAQIEQRNPSRSIILTVQKQQPQVAMEHVQIGVTDLAAPQLQSVVHDLLVPGVRTVLLWAGASVTDPRFAALGELSDVIITFTSRTAQSETQTLADLVAMQQTPLGAKIRDLAFLRLAMWQDLVAQLFDEPDLLPELSSLEKIEVRAGTQTEPYYFMGWLASRLDWQPCGKHEFCNADGQTIRVSLRKQGPARRLHSVLLESAATAFEACVQKENDDLVCLSVTGAKARPQRCVPLSEVDMVSLIERAIFLPPDNTVFAETLAMVGRLLQHLA